MKVKKETTLINDNFYSHLDTRVPMAEYHVETHDSFLEAVESETWIVAVVKGLTDSQVN